MQSKILFSNPLAGALHSKYALRQFFAENNSGEGEDEEDDEIG